VKNNAKGASDGVPQDAPDRTQQGTFTRKKTFSSLYANYARLEPSVWDLKMVFGELDQSHGPFTIELHTAITIPWHQVKLLAYLFDAHLAIYESQNGPITLPDSLVPPAPDPPATHDKAAANVSAISRMEDYLRGRYDWFFGKRVVEKQRRSGTGPANPPLLQ
jgi:hypothetical protein